MMSARFFLAIPAILLGCVLSCVAQRNDTSQVRRLHKKSFSFLNANPDSLLFYRDSAYHLAVLIKDSQGIAESYTDLGIYHWLKGNYGAAISAYDTSIQIFTRLQRPDKQMTNFSNLGMVYSRLGDYPKAINFFLRSLRISEELNAKEVQAKTHNSIGVAYKNQNNLKAASEAYAKAVTLFKEVKNFENLAGTYSNIGNLYSQQEDLEQALRYQVKALAIFDSLQNFRGLITCYNNISEIQLDRKNLQEALNYRQRALALSQEKGFFSNEVSALSGIGRIYTALNDYKRAEQSFLKGIDLARNRNYRTEMIHLYKGLGECYKRLGRPGDALYYFERYTNLKDSLFNQQSQATISNLQTSYDLEKKEASIQLLKKDNEITTLSRNRTIIAAIALLLMAGLVVVWQRSKIRRDRQLHVQQKKLYETEQALTKAELGSARMKEEELLKELAYKNKSLTTYALSMVQKNEILEEVKESIELIIKKPDNQAEYFKKLSRIIDYNFSLDKDWEDFKLFFEEVHSDFFSKLREQYPDLGGADLKLCALIRLNMNVKQAATILRISPDSVKVARHRLRKKFNLQTEDNLTGFIMSL